MKTKQPMLTMKQKMELIGKKQVWNFGGFGIQVEILDVREIFGRVDFQVEPIAGTGKQWVSSDSMSKD